LYIVLEIYKNFRKWHFHRNFCNKKDKQWNAVSCNFT